MSGFQAILMLCAVGAIVGVGTPIWMIRQRWLLRLRTQDAVIGTAATIAGLFIPFAFFFLSDDWVQTVLRQHIASWF